MSKLFLSVGVVAFDSFISVSGSHAAVRVGDAMSLTSLLHRSLCASPQPLPPKIHGIGRTLRR
jgi:hypothetical protein